MATQAEQRDPAGGESPLSERDAAGASLGPAEPAADAPGARPGLALPLLRLARPTQWIKNVFVVVGPAYAFAEGKVVSWPAVALAVAAFSLAASGCYVVNDLQDAEADREHPRKRRRPIASGEVSPRIAAMYAVGLFTLAALATVAVWPAAGWQPALLLGVVVAIYVANVTLYSLAIKHAVILDVMSLALGFVLRVLGGCAAAAVAPSTWLLNTTFFLSMFLAFGKRLGERRTNREGAVAARSVQGLYTDELLRMVVVMTAVATLATYAGYVQDQAERYTWGFNLLWLTILPATFCLFRSIVLVEGGEYDDPTELAVRDTPFQAGAVVFGAMVLGLMLLSPA